MSLGASHKDKTSWGVDRVLAVAGRYGLSTIGLVGISGAHFLASLLFLQVFAPREFGLFSFVLVVVPLGLSCSGAMLGATVSIAAARSKSLNSAELSTILKANIVFSLLASLLVTLLMFSSGAPLESALLLGLYGGAMCLRWFGRTYCFAAQNRVRATFSDLAYSAILGSSLVGLWAGGALTMRNAVLAMLASATLAILALGLEFVRRQWNALFAGSLRLYAPIWRELTRWSLLGVISTEITANAHAYLVNLISGPNAFALLAAGALFLRPASLCLSALPDLERPVMARAIASGDYARAWRCANEMRVATGAMLLLTTIAAIGLLVWAPKLLLHHRYDATSVLIVTCLWAAITAARAARSAEGLLLQASGQFRDLANASVHSSVVSVAATLVLLAIGGPIASLGGILGGELVLTVRLLAIVRRWRAGLTAPEPVMDAAAVPG